MKLIESFVTPRRLPVVIAALASLLAGAPRAAAQMDLSVAKLEVNQVIQSGTTPLVGGRSTFVRATVRLVNPTVTPQPVDGLMRVFVNGVETADSPVFSDNGPFPAFPLAQQQPLSVEDATLNFIFLPPQSSNVVLTVEVNPPGPNFVPEANTANNSFSSNALTFVNHKVTELAYVPIDYRPSGGSIPNLPDLNRIRPGSGDNFVRGIYPTRDWNYHRTDAPSKLWTQSLAGDGSVLLNSLQVDLNLMAPPPDFLYGWVPGGLPYNGQSFIGGDVSMGNTELIRFQRTIAHELGHNFGLQHNNTLVGLVGVDVEDHLAITQGLPVIKASNLNDIMVAGLLTPEAWVAPSSLSVFFNHPVFVPSAAATLAGSPPALMVAGLWHKDTGAIELTDVLQLPAGQLTPPVAPAQADLLLRTFTRGGLLQELPLIARGFSDADSDQASPIVAFSAVLAGSGAGGAAIDRLTIDKAGARHVTPFALERSAAAPQVAFTAPAGGALAGPQLSVAWAGSDADGDTLHYFLRFSPDGQRFVPVVTSTTATVADVDLSTLPKLAAGKGFFELLASDGLNTTRVRSEPLSQAPSLGAGGNVPWINVISPDTGTSILRGATLILHGSGFDLEDRKLDGASLVWTDSVAGQVGTSRLTSVNTLSAGTHVLTLTGTDSDGMFATESTTITVVDRALPGDGGNLCQADLGFGGPGSSTLSVCGGDLSTGTSADLLLTGAPPLTTALLVVGVVNGPVPFKGGTLVPTPWLTIVPLTTSGAGEIALNGIAGGGGPVSAYLQFVLVDPAQAQGFGLSNAVRLDLLP